jgi:hypothetical protein
MFDLRSSALDLIRARNRRPRLEPCPLSLVSPAAPQVALKQSSLLSY